MSIAQQNVIPVDFIAAIEYGPKEPVKRKIMVVTNPLDKTIHAYYTSSNTSARFRMNIKDQLFPVCIDEECKFIGKKKVIVENTKGSRFNRNADALQKILTEEYFAQIEVLRDAQFGYAEKYLLQMTCDFDLQFINQMTPGNSTVRMMMRELGVQPLNNYKFQLIEDSGAVISHKRKEKKFSEWISKINEWMRGKGVTDIYKD